MVIGGVEGRFSAVFDKLTKLQSKNAFSFAVVVGDLFEDPSNTSPKLENELKTLLDGSITVPLAAYFTLGKRPLPPQIVERLEHSNGEVCPNLYFLGKRSTTKTSEGIRIVALGGSSDPNITAGLSKDKYLPFHTESDAKSLHGANTADILVTNQWPSLIRAGSKISLQDGVEETVGEQCIADLCSTLRPRYHFSNSPQFFYEREPFFHQPKDAEPDIHPITRFISLASFDNPLKQKWLYAFSLDPTATPPSSLPPGTTASPFAANPRKRHRLPDQDLSYSRFSTNENHHRPSKRAQARRPAPGPSECFFCLSNPDLATHLITSIATDTYLTTAKGPLSTTSTFPTLDFPSHILIIPLSHSPTLDSIPDEESRVSTYNEMQKYRQALHSMLLEKSKGELGAVTWEVSRAGGIHIHWQFLPVSVASIARGLVQAAFKVEAENEKYPLFTTKDIGDGVGEKTDYFRVWIWRPEEDRNEASSIRSIGTVSADVAQQPQDRSEQQSPAAVAPTSLSPKGQEKSLVLRLSSDFRFDLQFGRKVMAKLLRLEKRFDWRECLQSKSEEVADAEAFKAAFKMFDFSLEEG